jgi:phosphatidylserine synthase 1
MPVEHPICVFRILLSGLMAAPSTRQYYTFITDKRCKRLGSQAWVFICIAFSELILNLKFGKELFSQTQWKTMILWIVVNLCIAFLGMLASMKYYRLRYPTDVTLDEELTNSESSSQNFTKLRKRHVD